MGCACASESLRERECDRVCAAHGLRSDSGSPLAPLTHTQNALPFSSPFIASFLHRSLLPASLPSLPSPSSACSLPLTRRARASVCVCARAHTHTGFLVQVFALLQLVLKALHISRPFRTLGFLARQNALRVRVLRGHRLQLLHASRTHAQTKVRGESLLCSSFTLSSSALCP